MAKTIIIPTVEQIRVAHVTYLQKTRKQEPEKFVEESEEVLTAFN